MPGLINICIDMYFQFQVITKSRIKHSATLYFIIIPLNRILEYFKKTKTLFWKT